MRFLETQHEVIDTQTNLIWMKYVKECLTFEKALEYAECISKETGLDWRIPAIDELSSLVDRSRIDPASSFPDMPSDWFWSSTPYVGSANLVWGINFSRGYVYDLSSGSRLSCYAVRLVREG
jgi:hypothetical protein